MTELQQLQDQLQQFLLTGHSDIGVSIIATERVSADARLGIYRNAYRIRLIDSLVISFPGLYQYLGTKEFERLCGVFIEAHPSHYRSIRWYGDVLPDFIKHHYKKERAYLAELADLEWKMSLAFDAADTKVMLIDEMARVPP